MRKAGIPLDELPPSATEDVSIVEISEQELAELDAVLAKLPQNVLLRADAAVKIIKRRNEQVLERMRRHLARTMGPKNDK